LDCPGGVIGGKNGSEDVADWFDLEADGPYVLVAADVKAEHRCASTPDRQAGVGTEGLDAVRSSIPAATHVDCSVRVQTMHRDTNPRLHAPRTALMVHRCE